MNKKDYALISTGETTDFENSFLNFLRDWPSEKPPRSYVLVAMTDGTEDAEGDVVIYTYRATQNDMLLAKEHLGLQVQHEAVLENIGEYLRAARNEGLLPCQLDGPTDDGDDQIDTEGG